MGHHSRVEVKGQGLAGLQRVIRQLEISPEVKVGILIGKDGRSDVAQIGKKPASEIGNVELGIIHEFGSPAAGIPARYWLSGPADYHRREWLHLMEKVLGLALEGKISVTHALEIVGQRATADVRMGILGGVGLFPPNTPGTIHAKRSSRPLVDSRQFVNSISYAVGGDLGHSKQVASIKGGGAHH